MALITGQHNIILSLANLSYAISNCIFALQLSRICIFGTTGLWQRECGVFMIAIYFSTGIFFCRLQFCLSFSSDLIKNSYSINFTFQSIQDIPTVNKYDPLQLGLFSYFKRSRQALSSRKLGEWFLNYFYSTDNIIKVLCGSNKVTAWIFQVVWNYEQKGSNYDSVN